MKDKFIYIYLFLASVFVFQSCNDDASEYDIKFPVPKITEVTPIETFVDDNVTIKGTSLEDVTIVRINTVVATVLNQSDTEITIRVPRSATAGPILLHNKYRKEALSEVVFKPKYPDVIGVSWPNKIERKGNFKIKATNADMILKVTVNDMEATIMPNATTEAITVNVAGIDLSAVDEAVIKITTRSGNAVDSSPFIKVESMTDTYLPQKTIMLFDFETQPKTVAGDANSSTYPHTSGLNLNDITPAFGSYFSVLANVGNGWNGTYLTLLNDNDGKGFDMNLYNNPHITFMVNTNGKSGYAQPVLTINGSRSDKHLTGQGGEYSDDYKITTDGWEWRSYDLAKLGFDVSNKIEVVEIGFRGGNIGNGNTDPFEIHVDQIMITDGPLNPVIATKGETLLSFKAQNGGKLTLDGGSGLTGYHYGEHYLTNKKSGVPNWQYLGDFSIDNITLDAAKFKNGVFLNFLVNTGANSGYAQLEIVQGDNKGGKHFKGDNPYGDDYKFTTGSEWQWRSIQINPVAMEKWGGDPGSIDLSQPFTTKFGFSTGNVSGEFETHLDYIIFTTVPLDPGLNLHKD